MTTKILTLTLLLLATLTACDGKPQRLADLGVVEGADVTYLADSLEPLTAEVQLWHENGELAIEANYVNGKQEGLARMWWDNGRPWSERNYVNGETEGWHRVWHENGELEFERTYVNGKIEGLNRWWHYNGELKGENNLVNGKREGLQRRWNGAGKLQSEICYEGGEEVAMTHCTP